MRWPVTALGLAALVACVPTDNKSYGGGELSVELEAADSALFSESWTVAGLTGGDLSSRGKEWQTSWPDCEGGAGAWLYIDNDYPFQLRACGDGLALVLDMGRSFELGTTRDADRAGVSITMAESEDEDAAAWVAEDEVEGASLTLSQDALSGEYEDDALLLELSDGAPIEVSVEMDWAFDADTWVFVPAGEGP
ncbi:MAG: hypothetical protein H6740_19660 [Alphaproteobacteria bacterium]|nr:hypothetical protein [Alphaproteobacteria bacterium]